MSKYGVFSGPNAGKYGPEKTPYLDTFQALQVGLNKHAFWSNIDILYLQVTLDLLEAPLHLLFDLKIFHCYLLSDILQYV